MRCTPMCPQHREGHGQDRRGEREDVDGRGAEEGTGGGGGYSREAHEETREQGEHTECRTVC